MSSCGKRGAPAPRALGEEEGYRQERERRGSEPSECEWEGKGPVVRTEH